ncbi:MAG: hypothetical protein OXO50_04800 [Caldilineaceae bacterium]|nr:hypothetical protein [Caldilineaceae bacterium]
MRQVVNDVFYLTVGSVSDDARCQIPNRVVGSAYAFFIQVAGDGHCHRLMTGYGLKGASKRGDTSTRQDDTVSHLAGIVAPLGSQTVTTDYTPTGVRGLDGGKRISGCQRHILSDTMGLVLTLFVTSASVLDRNGACLLLERRTDLGRNYVSPDFMALRAALSKIGSHSDCVFACYIFCALKIRRDSLS